MQFGHLDIGFDGRVLRPRPWTSSQAEWAADLVRDLDRPAHVLELCAGAGHIGLLALGLAGAPSISHRLVTVDVNPVACAHARRNAAEAGLGPVVDVREGRIGGALTGDERFDLVIADPPWVARAGTNRFPDDPVVAIDGGPDGLDIAWECIRVGETHLVTGGSMVLQLGSTEQVDLVQDRLPAMAPHLSAHESRPFGTHGVLVRLTKGHAEAATC